MWRLRQVVKTPPSHGGFVSSNLTGVTIEMTDRNDAPVFFVASI